MGGGDRRQCDRGPCTRQGGHPTRQESRTVEQRVRIPSHRQINSPGDIVWHPHTPLVESSGSTACLTPVAVFGPEARTSSTARYNTPSRSPSLRVRLATPARLARWVAAPTIGFNSRGRRAPSTAWRGCWRRYGLCRQAGRTPVGSKSHLAPGAIGMTWVRSHTPRVSWSASRQRCDSSQHSASSPPAERHLIENPCIYGCSSYSGRCNWNRGWGQIR